MLNAANQALMNLPYLKSLQLDIIYRAPDERGIKDNSKIIILILQ